MNPLPKGITGFDALDGGVSVQKFTAACHAETRQVDGRILEVLPAYNPVTPNFHQAFIALQHGSQTIRVLCNAHYPLIAFATTAAYQGDAHLEFLDCPALADALSGEFTVIHGHDACAGIVPDLVAALGETELEQMHYWKPQRIGDVIFNHWD
jgi:hypothetical protein